MINIYLVIISFALLLANTGFFCDHTNVSHSQETLSLNTKPHTTANQESEEKHPLAELEKRLEHLSQQLTGLSQSLHQLKGTVAGHSEKLQNAPVTSKANIQRPPIIKPIQSCQSFTGSTQNISLVDTAARSL
ncbi:hypothetical protein SG34_012725 [Thalassomonas viridans]|uniref:Uncharacterized protein n=1 Tax=Thalassomonas viridans TaxID=137584 RepID=A0AAE9Z6I3_9GAMM|nr:hypothetical protein [Thalassomonas viridans]WDE07676.1 hypothetical protein SG34_012725 [Thalassomonas viridans]